MNETHAHEGAPVALNPFLQVVLQQLAVYVTSHADELVAAILKLFGASEEVPAEVQSAAEDYKAQPNMITFHKLVEAVGETGDVPMNKLAATVLTHSKEVE